jgi:transketolase
MNMNSLMDKAINTLRLLSIDMINAANSGHSGMPLGCAPMLLILWTQFMNFNPENPKWDERDRFILSNGHGCALLYSLLYLLGFSYTLDDLKNFRKIKSTTPGHPEFNQNLGIEVSTGPLGQGIANGVGMAIASKKMGYNNKIYVMCGDGCLMEGISYESASLAGHLCLDNLILLYDDNGITIDGKTDITFTENVKDRFTALNWNVLEVLDGDNDINDISDKISKAKSFKNKPTIIFVKTTIGYGSILQGKSAVHGIPLGNERTKLLKEKFGFDSNKEFYVDNDVVEYFKKIKTEKINYYNKCILEKKQITDSNNITDILNEINKLKNGKTSLSTRDSSGIVLKKINELYENIIIGSADLAESNKTKVCEHVISKDNFNNKYLNYGVREHSMCAIANGISTFDILPIVSTFLVFITYCLAPIRMAALSKHKVIYIFTHDSIFLGEDGPSHQPIESLTILRSIPNLLTIRPCDTTEVSGAYQIALEYNGPTALILSRQTLNNIETTSTDNMKKGAYIVYEPENSEFDKILIATGSEVNLALEIANYYKNIRVVSMPCCELFDKQDKLYKEYILPHNIKKISIEAGSTIGWYKYSDYAFGIDNFGESGSIADLKKYFGFTLENFVKFIDSLK